MVQFLKDSFRNGNRFTNILLSIIFVLIAAIGFFVKDIYQDFKDVKCLLNEHSIRLSVLEMQIKYQIEYLNSKNGNGGGK